MNIRLPIHWPETVREISAETVPLVGTLFVAGAPIIPAWAAIMLLGLMLAGPFALFAVLVLALVAAWAVLALVVAILAAPFVLVRRLRAHRTVHASTAPAPRPIAVQTPAVHTPQVVA